jgi:pimeloyl-ACP methyl ester carboxylesterase
MTEAFFPWRGYRTWYRIVGDLARPAPGKFPVLMISGGPDIPHDHLESRQAVATTGRPAIFYDQLGCGNSDQPDDTALRS